MVDAVYILCAAVAALCSVMLFRAYWRARSRILLWSGLCFCGLTLNHLLVIIDKMVFPDIDLLFWRLLISLLAMMSLLYGVIFRSEGAEP